jgi:chemotaxis protein histidine kinase CheA
VDHLESIKQTFFQECEEQLAELESGLLTIDDGNHHPEIINAVFRAVHSIKGGAAAFGYDDLVEFVHVFETTLDLLRSESLTPSPAVLKVLLHAGDVLADLIHAIRNDAAWNEEPVREVKQSLEALCEGASGSAEGGADDSESFDFQPVAIDLGAIFGEEAEPVVAAQGYRIYFKPKPTLYARANEAIRVLRELRAFGENRVSCDYSDLPLLTELDAEGAYFAWTIEIDTSASLSDIEQTFDFVGADCDYSITPRDEAESPPIGEEEAQNPPEPQTVAPAPAPVEAEATRDAPARADPLTHMVRNAVDHGIEGPEERLAAGKPEEGTLRLSAMHRSGRIVIEVSDDGAGIDRATVREIATRKGLIAEGAVLSDEEVDGLIFLPGFSTNSKASSISGRGVGMDVVKRAIQALGGRMLDGLSDIGRENAAFARSFLANEGIRVIAENLGGARGRRVEFFPVSGRARQILLPRDAEVVDRGAAPKAPVYGSLELF